MILIFDGEDTKKSLPALDAYISNLSNHDILRVNYKDYDFNQVNLFINSLGLLAAPKTLVFHNFFSLNKAQQDKLIKIFNQSPVDIILWQDKTVTGAQLKIFPQATASHFPLPNYLFGCLNQIKPHNLTTFIKLYRINVSNNLTDILAYLIKSNLRKQLTGLSRFDQNILKATYLKLIETDYLNKSGQLDQPLQVAIENIMIDLLR